MATRVARIDRRAQRRRSGLVIVARVYCRNPSLMIESTVPRGEKAISVRPSAVACAGNRAAADGWVTGTCPDTFSM
jgi:hypothetical protein